MRPIYHETRPQYKFIHLFKPDPNAPPILIERAAVKGEDAHPKWFRRACRTARNHELEAITRVCACIGYAPDLGLSST
jgi:hypothetical protein